MSDSPSLEERLALDALVERLYVRLKPLAARLRWQGSNPTLNPTSLVHEAYLKLMNTKGLAAKPHEEVIGLFAHVMRQILVDAARRKHSRKRGGGAEFLPLDFHDADTPQKDAIALEDVITLESALSELERVDARQAKIVEFRFHLGLTADETANVLGLSKTMVEREERKAKSFLNSKIRPRKE
jgi:RNA polymerase sigma factor (TIGR02999 family)